MLIKPSSFKGDWYGFATNQCGHFVLGLIYVLTGSCLLPFVDPLYIAVFYLAIYIFVIELILQGYQGRDTWQDALFSYTGAFSTMYLLYGQKYHALAVICLFSVAIMWGIWERRK